MREGPYPEVVGIRSLNFVEGEAQSNDCRVRHRMVGVMAANAVEETVMASPVAMDAMS